MQVTDRSRRPIDFSQQLWTSRSSAWTGFHLEQHRVGPAGELRDFEVGDVLLGVCVGGRAELEIGDTAGSSRVVMREGRFILLSRGTQSKSIAWVGTRETLYVHLDGNELARLAAPLTGADGGRLLPQYAVADPQVHRLALCMRDEAAAGCPAGPLYSQSLSLALVQHLWAHYAAGARALAAGATLSAAQRSRIESYIEAQLHRAVTLLELAGIVGLSPHYFTQVFKNTYRTTPHRYLTARRVEAAKCRLKADAASISDVGFSLGFADQSHFTSVFRRATGLTPQRFRRGA